MLDSASRTLTAEFIIPSCMGLIRVKSSVAMAASHWENSVTMVNCRDLARGCDLRHIGEKARDRKLSNRLVLARGISWKKQYVDETVVHY